MTAGLAITQDVGATQVIDLSGMVEACWHGVGTDGAVLHNEAEGRSRADRSRLAQLLENLMGNATKHGDDGVTVTVGTLDGGFYVADDGPGIPEGRREEVFDPGHSTDDDGTGVGLSTVAAIVAAHGWEIDVTESTEGGARFEITGVEIDPTS